MHKEVDKNREIHKDQHDHSHSCCGDCCCDSHTFNLEGDYAFSLGSINSKEISFMLELVKHSYLPVSRFIMSSSIETEARIVSLEPVFINDIDDNMETVKEIGKVLSELEKKGVISLDYDIPLQGYEYTQFKESALFSYFQDTVNEGKRNLSFLFDTAEIELGSIALTEFGERVFENIREDSIRR